MYKEILDIIYRYSFNYMLPDRDFVMNIVNIVIKNMKLNDYIKTISFSYDGSAAYKYISKELNFNLFSIINASEEKYNSSIKCEGYKYEKYLYLCFDVIEIIFHEFEHIRQGKIYNTVNENSFEKGLICNNLDYLGVNPYVYKKEHDLFTIERLAIIKSQLGVLKLICLDSEIPTYIKEKFINYYNYFVELYYRFNSYPLLEYVKKTGTSIYYNNILINKSNTNKLLKKTKKELSLEDRLLYGFPINCKEYIDILKKAMG